VSYPIIKGYAHTHNNSELIYGRLKPLALYKGNAQKYKGFETKLHCPLLRLNSIQAPFFKIGPSGCPLLTAFFSFLPSSVPAQALARLS
jgi:hypothetical protein